MKYRIIETDRDTFRVQYKYRWLPFWIEYDSWNFCFTETRAKEKLEALKAGKKKKEKKYPKIVYMESDGQVVSINLKGK